MSEDADLIAAMESHLAKIKLKLQNDRLQMAQLEKMLAEYSEVDETLCLILSKRKHPIMVPLGKKAFIPGYITHTNEVTVALGENYFVKCSVEHAREIAGRRRLYVQENLSRIQGEFNLVKEQLGITSSLVGTNKMDDIFIRETSTESFETEVPSSTQRPKIEVLGQTTQLPDGSIGIYEEYKEGRVGVVGRTSQLPDGSIEIFEEYMEDSPSPSQPLNFSQKSKKERTTLFVDEDLELLQRFSRMEQDDQSTEAPIETLPPQQPRPGPLPPLVPAQSSPSFQTQKVVSQPPRSSTNEPAVRETIVERFSQPSPDSLPFVQPRPKQVQSLPPVQSLPSAQTQPTSPSGPSLPKVLSSTQGSTVSAPVQAPLIHPVAHQPLPTVQQPEKKVSLFKQRQQQQQGKS